MRTLKLSHQEIEIIKTALQHVYNHKLKIITQNRELLGEEITSKIFQSANPYLDTLDVFEGKRDV